MTNTIQPGDDQFEEGAAPHLVIKATVVDGATGALWAWNQAQGAYQELIKPYSHQEHIPPIRDVREFGSLTAWSEYVKRFAKPDTTLITWRVEHGITAILDYHHPLTGEPGRCQWTARFPFKRSREWLAWAGLFASSPVPQKKAVEFLEDWRGTILVPAEAVILNLLRGLRITVNKVATPELRENGTAAVAFGDDRNAVGRDGVEVPTLLTIHLPVLDGDAIEGEFWDIEVRVRLDVDDNAKLGLRFSAPQADAVLEAVLAARLDVARTLLGETFPILRAAD